MTLGPKTMQRASERSGMEGGTAATKRRKPLGLEMGMKLFERYVDRLSEPGVFLREQPCVMHGIAATRKRPHAFMDKDKDRGTWNLTVGFTPTPGCLYDALWVRLRTSRS